MVLKDINVLIGVTGGIAAYKTLSLIRQLRKAGCSVKVILTENGAKFITALSFESISGNPVYDDTFARRESFSHISLRDWADMLIVAPATANFISKAANGLADDLLSTLALSFHKERYVCPAMNSGMWDAAATQRNLLVMANDGWQVIGPGSGELACGVTGQGRMSEPEEIVETIFGSGKMDGKIVVTAGATIQPVDAVRFLSNRSTGKMGCAVAEAAARRFTEVVLIHASLSVPVPDGVRVVEAETAAEMLDALSVELKGAHVLVMAAAVSDFTPEAVHSGKIKKHGSSELTLRLVATPDILKETRSLRENVFTVGFAMESENMEDNARQKLSKKGLDCIVANPLGLDDAGFASDTNRVVFMDKTGGREDWGLLLKSEVASKIVAKFPDIST